VHLMAISGLHIGLVAGLVYWLASIFWIRTGCLFYSPFKVASVCALAAALGYATLAGFSIPTRRALIMLAVALFALMRLRHVSSGHILALALFAVLLADPLAILAPGFWLSFTAVAAILYTVSGRLASEKKWLVAMRIHWLTALALSPLLIGFFQQVSLIAPIANVVAVPVVSLIVVPMSLAAILMLPIAQAPADMLFALADRVLQALDIVLAKLAALPFAYVHLPQPPFYALLLAVPALLLLLAPKGIPARWLGWVMLLPMIFFKPSKLAPGETELILLDVGQGLAAVVRTAHHVLVYDTGPRFDSGFDMGSAVVVPYLYSQGVGHLDTLIVSHGDNDHIGGADSLLRAMPVTSVYSSEPQRLSEYSAGLCKAGQTWIWDDIRFTMLAPEAGFTKAGNDSSCVLKIESNHTSALLTGDIEKPTESLLVEKYGEKLHA
ncbi:MAG: DNA internalization-related competence protein ComEC/Rec2, partial [Gammaproteobacteria bacterium]